MPGPFAVAGLTQLSALLVTSPESALVQRSGLKNRDIRDGKDWKQKTEFVEHEDTVTEEGVWEFDATGANRALELLGKHLNIFHENDTLKNLLKDTEISFTKHYDKK